MSHLPRQIRTHCIIWVNDRKIRYYIRIKNNFLVQIPNKKDKIKVSWLFGSCGVGEFRHHSKVVKIGTQACHISGCKPRSKGNNPDFLIIISFNKPEQAQIKYAERWQLETYFYEKYIVMQSCLKSNKDNQVFMSITSQFNFA